VLSQHFSQARAENGPILSNFDQVGLQRLRKILMQQTNIIWKFVITPFDLIYMNVAHNLSGVMWAEKR